jgi:hypothetical protein
VEIFTKVMFDTGGIAQKKCLRSKCEALSSNPSATKKEKKRFGYSRLISFHLHAYNCHFKQ